MLNTLNTPCLLLNKQKLVKNIERVASLTKRTGVKLRPHLKTAKCIQVAQLLSDIIEIDKTPITVSTLREAEYFAEAGFLDVLYAVSIEPGKFERMSKLLKSGVALTVVLDDIDVAMQLQEFCAQKDVCAKVIIEVDVDGHRAGLVPQEQAIDHLAAYLVQSNNIEFCGLMTHAGESYECTNLQQVAEHALLEQNSMREVKRRLVSKGICEPYLSIGSTPTILASDSFSEIDEVRPGVFVFMDLFQSQLGLAPVDDIATSVLTTVVAHKKEFNRLLLDAGGLALSKDRSTAGQKTDCGFGLVTNLSGEPFTPSIVVNGVNQEHGVVDLPEGFSCDDFPIGTKLRILPNHACMTAAAYEGYVVLEDESANGPYEFWSRCNGW